MKKVLAILMIMTLLIGLVACGAPAAPAKTEAPKADAKATTKAADAKATTKAADAKATTKAADAKPADGKPLKVTFVVGATLGDKSFNDSAKAGLDKAVKDFGIQLKIIELGGDTSKQQPTLLDVSDAKTDLVICSTGGTVEIVQKIAKDYPDVKYLLFDVQPNFKPANKNILGITFKQNEASFLAGAVGAKISKTGVLGFIGGQENPTINDFLVGYIDGAKKINPQAKIAVSFTGNWTDSAKGKELSLSMINNQKVDVLHGVAGGAGVGVIEAAAEKKLFALGVDSDQYKMFAGDKQAMADVIVTSALKNVGNTLYNSIEGLKKGSMEWGQTIAMGIKEGAVGYANNENYKKIVPEAAQKEIAALEKDIIEGKYKVPSAFQMSNDEFVALKNSVKP